MVLIDMGSLPRRERMYNGSVGVLALYGAVLACFWRDQKQGPQTFVYAFLYFFCAMSVRLLGLIP